MTEPRARAARHKGQLNFESESMSPYLPSFTSISFRSNTDFCPVRTYLYAFGDVKDPLDETVRVLDELATDFVIETCHKANQVANLSGRQKVKVDDFKFAIRGDEAMLGRVQELLTMDRTLKVSDFLARVSCSCCPGDWGKRRNCDPGIGRSKAIEFIDHEEHC